MIGQKCKVSEIIDGDILKISTSFNIVGCDIDISCFGVDKQEKLFDDRYFIFYNQLSSPEGAIQKDAVKDEFNIRLNALPVDIDKLVITAAIDGNMTLNSLEKSTMTIGNHDACVEFCGHHFQKEKAIILMEVYRRDGLWRIAVVGKGFNGGLSALLAHFGGEEIKEEEEAVTKPVSLNKAEKVKIVVLEKAPQLIDLTKKAIVSIEKKNLMDVKAQVILVLDVSGSMYDQYAKGRVQRILDKVMPLSLLFDYDGQLECWAFATKHRRLTDVTVHNIQDYISTADGGWKNWHIGGTNNEPEVMEKIYLKHKQSTIPVYIIFISDGGVSKNRKIKEIIKTAAYEPMFWQFIGIHGRNYGALEQLDELSGRYVDNANFFALDDIDTISDEALYDRMMNEFPLWLRAAKEKNIL